MVKLDFTATTGLVEFAITIHLFPTDPGAHGPTGKRDSVPGAPATFRELMFVEYCFGFLEIDQYQVGVIPNGDSPFANEIPDSGGGVAHPMRDLLQRAMSLVCLVQYEGQRIFDSWQA